MEAESYGNAEASFLKQIRKWVRVENAYPNININICIYNIKLIL